jgi:hypothetical protein
MNEEIFAASIEYSTHVDYQKCLTAVVQLMMLKLKV